MPPFCRELATPLGMVDDQGQACVCQNSLDAVSERDFAIEFTAAASLCMVHISNKTSNGISDGMNHSRNNDIVIT